MDAVFYAVYDKDLDSYIQVYPSEEQAADYVGRANYYQVVPVTLQQIKGGANPVIVPLCRCA